MIGITSIDESNPVVIPIWVEVVKVSLDLTGKILILIKED